MLRESFDDDAAGAVGEVVGDGWTRLETADKESKQPHGECKIKGLSLRLSKALRRLRGICFSVRAWATSWACKDKSQSEQGGAGDVAY